jgi:hypothetical protein
MPPEHRISFTLEDLKEVILAEARKKYPEIPKVAYVSFEYNESQPSFPNSIVLSSYPNYWPKGIKIYWYDEVKNGK